MKNREKPEILIPKGYSIDEMLDMDGDLWDEKPIGVEEVKIHFSEIEKIIVKLYEEKVCGRMSEDRFELLAKNYETEQSALKQKIGFLKAGLAEAEESDDSISKFISLVRSYTEVNELTPEILNSFIDKIYIGKPERINGQRVQEVKIVYKLVGAVNIPQ